MIINGISIKSEKKQNEELIVLRDKVDFKNDGSSGFLRVGENIFNYKNVKYIIVVFRHYSLKLMCFKKCHKDSASEYHADLEFPKSIEKLVKLINIFRRPSEFLYHTTVCTDGLSIQDAINECHVEAKKNIDEIPNILKVGQKYLDTIKKISKIK